MDVADFREDNHTDMRPDLALYPTDNKNARMAYSFTEAEKKKLGVSDARKPFVARCAWGWMMVFVECKWPDDKNAAFGFSDDREFLPSEWKAQLARAQVSKYASEIQGRQHRTHLISVYISGRRARLKRWDRAGCYVSEWIDLKTDYVKFANFVYRLGRLNSEQIGYDPTAVLATAADIKKIRDYKSPIRDLMEYRNHMLCSTYEFPIHKVSITLHLVGLLY